jgi:hypothetical protein
MHVIYPSKGEMKCLGCALSIEKYGNYFSILQIILSAIITLQHAVTEKIQESVLHIKLMKKDVQYLVLEYPLVSQ